MDDIRQDQSACNIDDFARAAADQVRDFWIWRYERLASRCQSPIEKMLLSAFLAFGDGAPLCPRWSNAEYKPDIEPSWSDRATGYVQAKIAPYTADFLIVDHTQGGTLLVIECDGHAFHERTKKQAAHDRSRDRAMLLSGHRVLRFTRSEIFADAAACVEQVIEALNQ